MTSHPGHLVLIGGATDRVPDRDILARAAHLAGGARSHLVVLMVGGDEAKLQLHTRALAALGVTDLRGFCLEKAQAAHDPELVTALGQASGILLVGTNARLVVNSLFDTPALQAIKDGLATRGACLVTVGAAGAAIAEHMALAGKGDLHPRAVPLELTPGLELLRGVLIDSSFGEQQRMGRLLSCVAHAPEVLGVGIDAHAALIVKLGKGIEVVGRATVTVLDARTMTHCGPEAATPDAILAMGNVQLHLLPAGFTYDLVAGLPAGMGVPSPKVPPALGQLMQILAAGQRAPALAKKKAKL